MGARGLRAVSVGGLATERLRVRQLRSPGEADERDAAVFVVDAQSCVVRGVGDDLDERPGNLAVVARALMNGSARVGRKAGRVSARLRRAWVQVTSRHPRAS